VASGSTELPPTATQPASIYFAPTTNNAYLVPTPGASIALIPAVVTISSLTSRTNPYLQALDALTAVFVNVGGGANSIRIRANTFDGAGNYARPLAIVGVGPDATAFNVAAGTSFCPPLNAGGQRITAGVLPAFTAPSLDVTVAFLAAGNKSVVLNVGGVQFFSDSFAVN
jgi:hypothetical protein